MSGTIVAILTGALCGYLGYKARAPYWLAASVYVIGCMSGIAFVALSK